MASRARHWMALIAVLLLLAPSSAGASRRPAPAKRPGTAQVGRAHRPQVTHRVRRTRAPRSEEERAILAIEQDGARRVQALLRATRGWTDKAMLGARERRIAEMRRDTRTRQLQVRATFARRRGDHAEAAGIEREMGPDPRGRRRGA
jgi:hypothetical protein